MSYKEHKAKLLNNPDVKKEYDAFKPEFELILAMMKVREAKGITQKELSFLTGITQADISRIETGERNPSIRVMQKLANAMGMTFELVPLTE